MLRQTSPELQETAYVAPVTYAEHGSQAIEVNVETVAAEGIREAGQAVRHDHHARWVRHADMVQANMLRAQMG